MSIRLSTSAVLARPGDHLLLDKPSAIRDVARYRDDRKDGLALVFNRTGRLSEIRRYRDVKKPSQVRRAGVYRDHQKHGRHYYFDVRGRLERIADFAADDYHGQIIECYPGGGVQQISEWKAGKLDGLVRRWAPDGTFKYATRYRQNKRLGRTRAGGGPAPDLCRPAVCRL